MGLQLTEWHFYLYERHASGVDTPIADSTGVINILAADDPSEVTLYADTSGSSASNPLTFTNGRVRFYTAASVTSVDITGLTAKGHAFFYQGITPSVHRIVIDPTRVSHTLVIPYQVVGASETIVDTGFDILNNMLVRDCFVHVTTAGTGATLDIGTSTDSDGFVDGVSAATTGYPVTLLEEVLTSATQIGALLSIALTADYVRKLHKRANATSGANIVYTNTTSSSTAGEGYIHIQYHRVPTTGG
jgi:hypothetical protein